MSWEGACSYMEQLPSWGKAAVAGGLALALYIPYRYLTSRPRKSPLKDNWVKDMVYLYQFPRTKHCPSISPYCLKLETWLRMADLPYENVPCGLTTRSREGTLPFVELNGQELVDSAFIIRDLTNLLDKKQLEEHLSDEQRSASRAFERLCETSLTQSHMTFKIENVDKIVEQMPPHLFGGALFPLFAHVFRSSFAKSKRTMLMFTGMGKHSRDDQISIGSDDLRAISKYLGAKHYLTGFKPTRVDATLFGVLSQIAFAPYDNAHLELMKTECSNLMEYVERIKHRYWPDWGEATTHYSIDSNWKKRPRRESPKRMEQH